MADIFASKSSSGRLARVLALALSLLVASGSQATLTPLGTVPLEAADYRGLAIDPRTGDLIIYDCSDQVVRFLEPSYDPASSRFSFSIADEVEVPHEGSIKCLLAVDPGTGLTYLLVQKTLVAGFLNFWERMDIDVFDGRDRVTTLSVNPDGGMPSNDPVDGNYRYAGMAFRPAGIDGQHARIVIFDTRGGRIDVADLDATGTALANVQRFDSRADKEGSVRVTRINQAVLDHGGPDDLLLVADSNGDDQGFAMSRFRLNRGIPPNPTTLPDVPLSFTGTGIKGLFYDPATRTVIGTTQAEGLGQGNVVAFDPATASQRTVLFPNADRGHVAFDASRTGRFFLVTSDLLAADPPGIVREFLDDVEVASATIGPAPFGDPTPLAVDPQRQLLYVAEADGITIFGIGQPTGPFANPDRDADELTPAVPGEAGDRFGSAVAVAGNRVFVGSPGVDGGDAGSGTVTIFRREGTGLVREDTLAPGTEFTAEGFGIALAVDGNRLVVGAREPTGRRKGAGALQAAIFERLAQGWTYKAPLVPSGAEPGDRFGSAVAIDGETIYVGAPGDDGGGSDAGAVHVFDFDGEVATRAGTIPPPDPVTDGAFGTSLDAKGGLLAAGAPGSIGAAVRGSASLFGTVAGNLALLGSTRSELPGDEFGRSVAIAGERMLVGIPGRNGGAGDDVGAALLFRYDGSGLVAAGILTANDSAAGSRFGAAVATDEDGLAVGAPGAEGGAGAVYRFTAAIEPFLLERIVDREPRSGLGSSVSIDGPNIAAGAPETAGERGAATLFGSLDQVFRADFE